MVIFTYSFLAFIVILCLAFYAIWPTLKRQHRWRKNQKCVVPTLASQWRHHSGTVYTVYDVTNETSQDNRFIITISYTEVGSGVHWSRPVHDFLSSCEPLDPLVSLLEQATKKD